MSTPHPGEMRLFAGATPPDGWLLCDGQSLLVSEYPDLFAAIGTTYGGDGQTEFALPDLRGCVPVHQDGGSAYAVGDSGGSEAVELITDTMPSHTHTVTAQTNPGQEGDPEGNVLAHSGLVDPYSVRPPNTTLAEGSIGMTGNSQPHPNIQPYLSISVMIAT